MTYPIKQLSS